MAERNPAVRPPEQEQPLTATLEVRAAWAADCHRLLLRLAGRIADRALTRARTHLADGHRRTLALELLQALLEGAVPLADDDEDLLAELLEADGCDSSPLDGLPPEPGSWLPSHDFAPGPEGGRTWDDLDRTAIGVVAGESGVRGLWRSRRLPADGHETAARRVFVVEAGRETDLPRLAGLLQWVLAAYGEPDPQVEVYSTGEQPPLYQRLARSRGVLLWAHDADASLSLVPLGDDTEPGTGVGFSADHPRIEDREELRQIASYLRSGELLLVTPERLDDVLDPSRRRAVPLNIRTDGRWIWTDTMTYYLEQHALAPPARMLAHLRQARYQAPVVDDVSRHRALDLLLDQGVPDPPFTPRADPAAL
ncbi:hypothetical protein [Streptomyces mirabilis]|uniref:hypothetical protein n=1 Tax=Streptomyces mirabilis TaxID=68239 RepID=UPI003827FFAE